MLLYTTIINHNSMCSGCKESKPTVDRHMFDGMCADCTDKALYDYDFAKEAKEYNKNIIRGY
jgi:hypothetical protein